MGRRHIGPVGKHLFHNGLIAALSFGLEDPKRRIGEHQRVAVLALDKCGPIGVRLPIRGLKGGIMDRRPIPSLPRVTNGSYSHVCPLYPNSLIGQQTITRNVLS